MSRELKYKSDNSELSSVTGDNPDSFGHCEFCKGRALKLLYAKKENMVIAFNLCWACAGTLGSDLANWGVPTVKAG